MGFIKRDLEEKILALVEDYACILITGPRQVGKTTVLKNMMTASEYVSMTGLILK